MALRRAQGLLITSIGLVVHLSLTALFWYAYEIRYARHIDCFNDQGRCYVPGEGVLTTGGAFWGLFALLFGVLALFKIARLLIICLRHCRSSPDQG